MNKYPPSSAESHIRIQKKAFSLVEVVLALGIISFALLAVVGVMSVGLTTMRAAMDNTVEGQIFQKINAEVLLTPFSQLTANFSAKAYYYNEEGTFLTNSPAVAPSATRYWVTTTLSNTVYPGSSNAIISNNISTMNIMIVTAASADAANRSSNIYNVQVPNSGN